MPLELIKENDKGKTYQADGFKILYRHKGSVSGDNAENSAELLYLISGSAEITLQDKTWAIAAPHVFTFPASTYHKIVASTDIILLLFDD